MIFLKLLYSIVNGISRDNSESILNEDVENLNWKPQFTPKTIIGDHFTTPNTDVKIIDKQTKKKIEE